LPQGFSSSSDCASTQAQDTPSRPQSAANLHTQAVEMVARRRTLLPSAVCLAVAAVLAFHVLGTSFVAPREGVTRPRLTPRASFESGKINMGVELGESKNLPKPLLEANEATNLAIANCIEGGCSVEALMELDQKLARDEGKIQSSIEEVKAVQKTAFSQDNVEALVWFDNFLQRTGGLRAQLQALQGAKDSDFAKQLVKAASVAFGGGRETDYPKVGVSPYSA